jgi:hypothetical protein
MAEHTTLITHRRGFLGRIGAAIALGMTGLGPVRLAAESAPDVPPSGKADPFEDWLNKINGTHRMAFDAPHANEGFPAVWPRIYMNTMNATYGTKDSDDSVVLILRHEAAPLALNDAMWAKYPFGQQLGINENGKPATRNIYTTITNLPIPGIGVAELLKSGVLVGVCNVALTVGASQLAAKTGGNADAIKSELVANLIPGIQVVPSGVMAVGRVQEKGCNYCYAG